MCLLICFEGYFNSTLISCRVGSNFLLGVCQTKIMGVEFVLSHFGGERERMCVCTWVLYGLQTFTHQFMGVITMHTCPILCIKLACDVAANAAASHLKKLKGSSHATYDRLQTYITLVGKRSSFYRIGNSNNAGERQTFPTSSNTH